MSLNAILNIMPIYMVSLLLFEEKKLNGGQAQVHAIIADEKYQTTSTTFKSPSIILFPHCMLAARDIFDQHGPFFVVLVIIKLSMLRTMSKLIFIF